MLACFCKECGEKMKRVIRYDPSGSWIFYSCPKCHFETKPKKAIQENKEDNVDEAKIIRKGNSFRYER